MENDKKDENWELKKVAQDRGGMEESIYGGDYPYWIVEQQRKKKYMVW